MCDDDIHPGVPAAPAFSRRVFGLFTLAASLFGGAARAQSAVVEKDVRINTPDGLADAALFHPDSSGPWPSVLIWPDILSLRPVFREIGRALAAEGYVVLIPNLYYRIKAAPVVDESFNFANPADRARLTPMRETVTPEGSARDALSYLAFLDAQPETDAARKTGTLGYCLGGPLAFQTAAAAPLRIGAVASFHGAGLVDATPDSPHSLIAATKAEYLILIADNDDQRDPAAKTTLSDTLKAANLAGQVEVFTGANHGWTVKGGQAYDPAAAHRAWTKLLALYRRTLT